MLRINNLSRSAFTLIELLVVITIISLLIAILLPALSAARDAARSLQCGSNLRQFVVATYAYANDHDSYWVNGNYYSTDPLTRDSNAWFTNLTPYMTDKGHKSVLHDLAAADRPDYNAIWNKMICPARNITDTTPWHFQGVPLTYGLSAGGDWHGGIRSYDKGYGLMNYYSPYNYPVPWSHVTRRIGQITHPSQCLAYSDCWSMDYIYALMYAYEGSVLPDGNHIDMTGIHPNHTYNVVFADGHVESISEKRIRDDSDPMWRAVW